MPGTEKLFALDVFNGVFYKADPSDTWHNITPAAMTYGSPTLTGMEFSHQTPGKVIVMASAIGYPPGYGDTSSMFVYDVSGTTWSQYKTAIPHCTEPYRSGDRSRNNMLFTLSATDTAYIALPFYDSTLSANIRPLITTPITSFAPTIITNNFPNIIASSTNAMQFAISQSNSKVIYLANYDAHINQAFYKSTDGGITFPYTYPSHADGRCIYINKDSSNTLYDNVFFGSDGGVREKRAGSATIDNITGDSLAITQFFGFGNTEANEDIMSGGSQDDNLFNYNKKRAIPWDNKDIEGDAYTSKFMKDGIEESLGEGDFPVLHLTSFSDTTDVSTLASVTTITDPSSNANRPIHFSEDSIGYVGYSHIWVMDFGSLTSTWGKFFTNDPIDYGTGFFNKLVADFFINDKVQDTAYIVYRDATIGSNGEYHDPLLDTFGKLYVSFNAKTPFGPALRTNISPSIVSSTNINSIAVDPNNNSRIWIALGNINSAYVGANPDTMKNRVWYSANAGGTWTDVSSGLSALPVNKLVYRKGSNDELYAGTDIGVFKFNKTTSTWECFSTGMPPCLVTDMEINYCAGKLRVSTYGRGIWETPLDTISTNNPVPETRITTSTTWNKNMWLESSIDIKSGATLTITGDTIHMPKNSLIVVEAGGHLIIDHAEITNSCESCFWQGIQAWGQVTLPQYPSSNQGWVTIKNGSTIQHALVGVANGDQSVIWSKNGGIIQASNSFFVDDRTSAYFSVYDNFYPDRSLHPNVSYFANCKFILDNYYKGNFINAPMQYMVFMGSVEGVRFTGCQFLNRDTFAINRNIGEGIHAVNTGFLVGGFCSLTTGCIGTAGTIPSRFCGFTNGINIQSSRSNPITVSIDDTYFDTVSVGEYVTAFNNVSTTRCNFKVGNGTSVLDVNSTAFTSCHQNIGIYNQNSNRFRIEGNTFSGKPNSVVSDWTNYGVVIANSDTNHINNVYRNNFADSLTMGVFSLGCNQLFGRSTGLTATCNSFSKNDNDIYIASDGSRAYSQGMATYQGSRTLPAANTFSGSTHNIVNNGYLYTTYFYNAGVSVEIPYDFSSGTTIGGMALYTASPANSCLSTFNVLYPPTTVLDRTPLLAHKSAFMANKTIYQDSTAVYNSKIDFGNTDSLSGIVSASSDTALLYSLLSSGSPFISEKVFTRVGDLMKLPHTSMVSILQENPDDLIDTNFLMHLDSEYSFTSNDLYLLNLAAHTTSIRTPLENSINQAQVNIGNETNLIMMALTSSVDTNISVTDTTGAGICTDSNNVFYSLDSNSYYVDLDSVNTWLQNIGGLSSQYERVGYYNFLGSYGKADSIFSAIATALPDSTLDWYVYNTYAKLWHAVYNAELAGRNEWMLTPTEISEIDTFSTPIVTYNTGSQASWALSTGVLSSGTTTTKGTLIPCLNIVITHARIAANGGGNGNNNIVMPITNISQPSADGSQFAAYPNPTTGVVTFSYNVPNGGVTITITNVIGEKVSELSSSNNSGNLYWNPNQLPTGLYLYQAQNKNGNISKGKLILAR